MSRLRGLREAKTASRLRELREAKGWRREDVASRAGVSRETVQRLERPDVNPTLGVARSIADALETTVEDLFPPAENAA